LPPRGKDSASQVRSGSGKRREPSEGGEKRPQLQPYYIEFRLRRANRGHGGVSPVSSHAQPAGSVFFTPSAGFKIDLFSPQKQAGQYLNTSRVSSARTARKRSWREDDLGSPARLFIRSPLPTSSLHLQLTRFGLI